MSRSLKKLLFFFITVHLNSMLSGICILFFVFLFFVLFCFVFFLVFIPFFSYFLTYVILVVWMQYSEEVPKFNVTHLLLY
jgi:hypothetical protein